MFIVTAYAPPTFLKPCLVWRTCKCVFGVHTLGCFVEGLNIDHAITLAHDGPQTWFLMALHSTWRAAMQYHLKLASQMQNGVGNDKWEAGYGPYLDILTQFEHAPQWKPTKEMA